MKACEVKGTNQGLVTTYKIFTSPYIALKTYSLEPFCFNNKFLHSSENR